jgi:tetratricopeptide (TPR) repeat protein
MRLKRLGAAVVWGVICGLAAWPGIGRAQAPITVREQIALGDREYDARRVPAALERYRAALTSEPKNYDALWKASRAEVDIAESLGKGKGQDEALARAEAYGNQAVAVEADGTEGHFALARAAGRRALSVGSRERIKFANLVRSEALAALKGDSLHAGALHVLAMWHAEVMRVDPISRMLARTLLGAAVFKLASWDEAQRLLERAVAVDPLRLVHRLDLAAVYADRGMKAKAREAYEYIVKAPQREFNDDVYQRMAAERLRKL